MSFKTLAMCALLALQFLGGLANATDTSAAEELVRTPSGLVPKLNVHVVPEGGRVHQTANEVQLISADGTILHSAPFTGFKTVSGQPKVSRTPHTIAPRALKSGYVAYTNWIYKGSSHLSSFSTSWAVPPPPEKKDGQLLYYFNALVPTPSCCPGITSILQPVLQFGKSATGGGAYWSVASWYLINGVAYHNNATQVQPGQNLTGVIDLISTSTSGSNTTYNWNSTFLGIPGSALSITTTNPLDKAIEALEIYNTPAAADLPTGTTIMTNINIRTQDNHNPPVLWTAFSDATDNILMTVISNSSTNGTVEITYPNP
ncbi:hypothetical protein BDZ97DRAFT_1766056 [Flammula alnicola]|nr:hypothetical protein BDZ97DRAFT_1766056 [Flammula alnicola]